MQFDAMTHERLLHCRGEVAPQVPAISHVDHAGCAAADGSGIRTGPIPEHVRVGREAAVEGGDEREHHGTPGDGARSSTFAERGMPLSTAAPP